MRRTTPWTRKVCVYRAAGPTDGHLIRDLLVADGIPVEMRGEQLTSLAGGIPLPDAWPTLWVVPHNVARRRAHLRGGGGRDGRAVALRLR